MKGNTVATLNITPDEATGIGKWEEADFVLAMRTGIVKGENALRYPMLPYALMTDAEAKAIYAYLRTIPKIQKRTDRVFYN